MKVSVQDAAVMTGLSRTKIYKDIKNGVITTETNDNNKVVIDASELSRVYEIEITDPKNNVQAIANGVQNNSVSRQSSGTSVEKHYLEAQIDMLKEERRREREQLEARIDSLEDTLKRSQETTILLEKKDNGEAGEWQQSLKVLESRISNQEKAAKEKAEEDTLEKIALEKQLTEQKKEIEEQAQALEEAKDAELKRKEEEYQAAQTWVSKMFGKKKTA